MCNAHNHPPGCTCGWGGKGHKGKGAGTGGYSSGVSAYGSLGATSKPPVKRVNKSSFVSTNAKCPVCGKKVFFYQSPDGGRVYFDALGWPWPKHPCTDSSIDLPKNIDKWSMCKCGRAIISPLSTSCPICVSEYEDPNRVETIKKNLRLIAKRLLVKRRQLQKGIAGYSMRMSIQSYDLELRRLNEYWSELSVLDTRYALKVFVRDTETHLTRPSSVYGR